MQAQTKLRQARLAAGETLIGWKVGFGAPAVRERLQIAAPLVGFLTSGTVLDSGAVVAAADWVKPAVEPEVAVTMGTDLGAGADRETARAAIAALGPAIELADIAFPADDPEAILAGNIYNRHVILGRADESRAGGRLDGLVGRIKVGGVETEPVIDLQAVPGNLIDLVRLVADTLGALGETLRAGEVIITGSIVPPIFVTKSSVIDYTLESMEPLRVALTV
jgi:2-keto-4-pentenoate hydratase